MIWTRDKTFIWTIYISTIDSERDKADADLLTYPSQARFTVTRAVAVDGHPSNVAYAWNKSPRRHHLQLILQLL